MLRVFKGIHAPADAALVKLSNRSMRGVGTKVGTVESIGCDGMDHAKAKANYRSKSPHVVRVAAVGVPAISRSHCGASGVAKTT